MPDNKPSSQPPLPVSKKPIKPAATSRMLGVRATYAEHFSGPLPPPDLMDRYERILPGASERIFKMAEKEQEHQHALEKTLPEIAKRGQLFGFMLGLSGIVGGVVLVAMGMSIAGFGVFLLSLGSLLGVYMYGQRIASSGKSAEENVNEQSPRDRADQQRLQKPEK